MTWHLRQTGYSLHFSCSYLTFILVTDCRLFTINRFCSQNTMNSLAMNSIEQWYYRSFELEGKLKKTGCCVFSAKKKKKKHSTNTNSLLYSITATPRNLQLRYFPTTLPSCLHATKQIKILFMYK